MNLQELMSMLKSNDIYPIRVENSSALDDRSYMIMIGKLEEFIETAKAVNETVVFINVRSVDESDFIYDSKERIKGTDLLRGYVA